MCDPYTFVSVIPDLISAYSCFMVTSLKSLFATTEIGIDEFGEEKISKIVDCGFILDVEGPLLLLLFDNMVKMYK